MVGSYISIKLLFFKSNKYTKLKVNKQKTNKKNLPRKKTPSSDGYTGDFHQIFREEILILHKLFLKNKEGRVPNR